MKAIILRAFGSVDELIPAELPTPAFSNAAEEVLIRVKAVSINPIDVKTRKGKGQAARLRKHDPMILGWDISGEVADAGSGQTDFKKGDQVFGMIRVPGIGEAYAEYVVAPAAHLALKPDNITHEEAAAAGIAAMTAWQALVTHGQVKPGQKLLIHAAAGGVGHYAVQIAKYLGAHVTGTSSAENRDFVLALGADEHIDYARQPFEEVAPEMDYILDAIGGEHIDRSLKVLRKGGTIVALPSGLSESVSEKAAAQGKHGIFFFAQSGPTDIRQLAGLLAEGRIRSFLSEKFGFDQMRQAHLHMETGKTQGKLALTV